MPHTSYLEELNPAQREAVQHPGGPIMILAGAGSGKTRTLTYRIAHLINQGLDPFRLLALTFTNKAAREMRARIERISGSEARNIWMGTFHSVFARILRIEGHHLGYPRDFTIYDTDDSKSLVKSIVKEKGLSTDLYKPNKVFGRISSAKNNFIRPRDYMDNEELLKEDQVRQMPKLAEVYDAYVKRCFKAGAMDFDDLLLKTYELFDAKPEVLEKWQDRFEHILVDEYQDTNHVQYLIVRQMAARHRNLCVVGDDAQSIYAFRGANIYNILHFERDYPDAATFKLEQNYRSTKNIVAASGAVIRKNQSQLQKDLWTDNEEGDKIKVFKALSDTEEARFVARHVHDELMQRRLPYHEAAVLYRTNAQSRSIEEALRKQNIPYKVVGGLSFYQRKEIKDMLAYFRLAINPDDEEAMKRVINYPARGIGKTTIDRLMVAADQHDTSLWAIVENAADFGFDSRTQKALEQFKLMIQRFGSMLHAASPFELAKEIGKESGLLNHLKQDRTDAEAMARAENIQELLNAVKEYEVRDSEEDGLTPEERSLATFMQEVSLLTDADSKDKNRDAVTLMTVHGAKGLEFDILFVVGLEESLFPSQMAADSREGLEEERRLFYVAVTRARKKLFLLYADQRYRFGNIIYNEPSRFIDEVDPRLLEYELQEDTGRRSYVDPAGQLRQEDQGPQPQAHGLGPRPKPRPAAKPIPKKRVSYTPSPDFTPQDLSNLQQGDRVEHFRFGMGEVQGVDGQGKDKKATIDFEQVGRKQIVLKFAKMMIRN